MINGEKREIGKILAERIQQAPTRPTLGNWVDIRILQNRAVLCALSPGATELLYFAGQNIGEGYGRLLEKTNDLQKGLEAYAREVEEKKFAKAEITQVDGERAVIQLTENAATYGLPNLNLKVCAFDAGVQAGMLAQLIGKRVVSTEVKCYANGDSCCEFEIRVISTAEAAFAEAFTPLDETEP